jgi:hypothetical protein
VISAVSETLPGIIDKLQMKRYRLLYFIVYKGGKVPEEPGLNARLIRLFDYKSDGHFYTDWNALHSEGYLVSKGGQVVATKAARKEFSFLTFLQLTEGISFGVTASLLFYLVADAFRLSVFGVALYNNNNVLLLSAVALLVIGILARKIFRDFAPELPSEEKIRDSRL